jgi:hypothetical protein
MLLGFGYQSVIMINADMDADARAAEKRSKQLALDLEATAKHNNNQLVVSESEESISLYKDGKVSKYPVNGEITQLIEKHYKLTDKKPCVEKEELVICNVVANSDYDAISIVPVGE